MLRKNTTMVAVALCIALFAAACGGGAETSTDGDASAGDDAQPDATGTAAEQPTGDEGDVPAGDPVTMSIAINPWIGYGPWYIAKEKGFDEANGISLDFVEFVEDKDLQAAVASGRLDSTHALLSSTLRWHEQGLPLKLVLFQDISTDADAIVAGPGIDSPADLEGKQVAFEEGGGGEMMLRLALEEHGLSIDDVEGVNLAAADAGAAVIAGRVDAAATYEPYLSRALGESDDAKVIATAGAWPGIIADVWMISEEFGEQHPEAVVGALRTWNDGVEFFRSNPDEALDILARIAGTDVEELSRQFEGVDLHDLDEAHAFMTNDLSQLADLVKTILRDQGALEGDPDISEATDLSYLEQARAE